MNRRQLFQRAAAGALAGSVPGISSAKDKSLKRRPTAPWKVDSLLWDRDGWRAGVGFEFRRLADRSVAIQIYTVKEQGYSSDVYIQGSEVFNLRSADMGVTWQRYTGPMLEECETRLRSGTLVKVRSGGLVSYEEKRKLLASVGANPDSAEELGEDLWPASMRAELEAKGYFVEKRFPGTIGTLSAISCRRSTDGGKTRPHIVIPNLPVLSRMYGSFRSCVELSDGAILASCTGRRKADSPEFSFVLRSTDEGKTWDYHIIAEDTSYKLQFNETQLFELPNGKVIAMMRCHLAGVGVGNYLYQSFSDDGGVHWSPFERTPIWGYPAHLTLLKSGKLLCTYTHRRHPHGIRACLSHDLGVTWDYENEIIVRDDGLPGVVLYPTSIQVDDGTILTCYGLAKIPRVLYREDDQVEMGKDIIVHRAKRMGTDQHSQGGVHGFAGLSRYTEDYVRAPGQTTNGTMFPA